MLLKSPLFAEILVTLNPAKIKIPYMNPLDGTKCPKEHIVAYKNLMLLYTTNQALLRKFFPTTLSGIFELVQIASSWGIHTFTC